MVQGRVRIEESHGRARIEKRAAPRLLQRRLGPTSTQQHSKGTAHAPRSLGLLQVLGVHHAEHGAVAVQQRARVKLLAIGLLHGAAHAAGRGQRRGGEQGWVGREGGASRRAAPGAQRGAADVQAAERRQPRSRAAASEPHRRVNRWVSRRSSKGSTPQPSSSARLPRLARLWGGGGGGGGGVQGRGRGSAGSGRAPRLRTHTLNQASRPPCAGRAHLALPAPPIPPTTNRGAGAPHGSHQARARAHRPQGSISYSGSSVRLTRIVSPRPSMSSAPMPIALFMRPSSPSPGGGGVRGSGWGA